MRRPRIAIAAVGAVLAALTLTSCAGASGDDSFMQKIPAALDSSDLGITESWADKGVDGFNTHVSVGATFDRSDITAADLQQLIAIVVEENTIDPRWLQLAIEDPAGDDIDIAPLLTELGAEPTVDAFVRIGYDEARTIAAESPR